MLSLLFIQLSFVDNYLFIYPVFILRNYFLLFFITIIKKLSNKNKISDENPIENYKGEFHMNVFSGTSIEVLTYLFITNTHTFINYNLLGEISYFIPMSFVSEIIFDFFHYWMHRISHTNKYLYINSHKKHHTYAHPSTIITFYQHPTDLLLTNTLPLVLTNYLFPYLSFNQFNLFLLFKSYLEICGHSGYYSKPSSCFAQFMWLPKLLNIELYTEDHDLHHSKNNCNYAKRFSLWDKAFGTYKHK